MELKCSKLSVMKVQLHRAVPNQNIARFYVVLVLPTLFGDRTLTREWGRIGSPGTVRSNAFKSEHDALTAAAHLIGRKKRRGYAAVH